MVISKQYRYVGPSNIKQSALNGIDCKQIHNNEDLMKRLMELGFIFQQNNSLIVTFVIDKTGLLRISDRHSEHVACASGQNVLSAGEMTFVYNDKKIFIENITNQSTGYCPEPSSWSAVKSALDQMKIVHPTYFEPAFCFRRCTYCRQTNLIKDNWFVCAVCESELPKHWNYNNEG